jgi:enediyne biosynthesis protein E4
LDLAVGVFGRNLLFRNLGDGTFAKQTNGPFVLDSQNSELVQWGDYDNDGWLDVVSVNASGQNKTLYRNGGDGTFNKVTTGSLVNDGGSSAGGSWTDYDNDGFLDLFIANWQGSRPNFLYRNAGNTNRWLKIRCVGSASNRSAIGARVSVTARIGGVERTQIRDVSGGIGFGQIDLPVHFGLGDADTVSSIRIEWPSGAVQTLGPMESRRTLTLHEPPQMKKLNLQGGVWRLDFLGVPQGRYRLETSPDLLVWQTSELEPVPVRPGEFQVQATATDVSSGFFRVSEY